MLFSLSTLSSRGQLWKEKRLLTYIWEIFYQDVEVRGFSSLTTSPASPD
jgi:hypothetical protein